MTPSWNPYNRGAVALLVPARSGVYAIERGGVVLYIGQARNLRERLCEHLPERENPLLALALGCGGACFAYAEVNPLLLDVIEANWIRDLHPTCNRRAA